MDNYLDNIQDKEEFMQSVKDSMNQTAFETLERMKTELANDFLTREEEQ